MIVVGVVGIAAGVASGSVDQDSDSAAEARYRCVGGIVHTAVGDVAQQPIACSWTRNARRRHHLAVPLSMSTTATAAPGGEPSGTGPADAVAATGDERRALAPPSEDSLLRTRNRPMAAVDEPPPTATRLFSGKGLCRHGGALDDAAGV